MSVQVGRRSDESRARATNVPLLLSAITVFALFVTPAHASAGGWYLLVPAQVPVEQAIARNPRPRDDWLIERATLSLDEPLIRWEHVRSFDSAGECENERRNRLARAQGSARSERRGFLAKAPSWLNSTPAEDKTLAPWDLVGHQVISEDIKKRHSKLQEFLRGLQELHSVRIASDDGRLRSQ